MVPTCISNSSSALEPSIAGNFRSAAVVRDTFLCMVHPQWFQIGKNVLVSILVTLSINFSDQYKKESNLVSNIKKCGNILMNYKFGTNARLNGMCTSTNCTGNNI